MPENTLKSWENGTIRLSRNGVKRCVAVYKSEGLIVDEGWIADGKGLDPTVRLSVSHYFSMPSDASLPVDEDDKIAMMRDANDFKNRYPNAVIMIVSNDEMSPCYEPQKTITDEANAIELLKQHPKINKGRSDNIKITDSCDLTLFDYYCSKNLQ